MKTYDVPPGENIFSACRNAVAAARDEGEPVTLTFNGLHILAMPNGDPSMLAQQYNEAHLTRYQERRRQRIWELADRIQSVAGREELFSILEEIIP